MTRKVRALIIRPDGVTEEVIGQDLETLANLVGGYVEAIRLGRTAIGLVNEDGKALKLPLNRRATLLCDVLEIGWHDDDKILGTMVVVGMADQEGYFTHVPKEIVEMLGKVEKLWDGDKG